VIVSRGEAVEIGGGVRVPEILKAGGARLVEVGTTNRTYLSDYRNAITENTALLLKVHTSNFKVIGFTDAPETGDLARLGREAGIPLVHDVGSGCLVDTRQFGLSEEPRPQESIAAGSDLVAFSGDKLLGGPQAGIIVGRQDLVTQLSRHPLARASRIDKMTMAALTATLLHYLKEEHFEKVPVWRMISRSQDAIRQSALAWREAIGRGTTVVETASTIGGGSLPGDTLSTWALQLHPPKGINVDSLALALRTAATPVIGRIEDDALLLDPRTVLQEQESALIESVVSALDTGPG
jgi:L-seryl-tRNA(Ser) seleniumtransferase